MTVSQQEPTAERIAGALAKARAGGGRGMLLPALHAVQEEFGYLPPAAIEQLAAELNLSRADVHGVAWSSSRTCSGTRPLGTRTSSCPGRRSWRRTARSPTPSGGSTGSGR